MSESRSQLSLGYSPCPNDTFIFYAMMHGKVDLGGLSYGAPYLEDVETLNSWALQSRLDVTKLSFHALGHVLDEYCVLATGSALGRGCGPLLVTGKEVDIDHLKDKRIAIPGKYTTAALLLQMLLPGCSNLVEMRFDMIMDAVKNGEVDAGVIIHESRFTYQQYGLFCLQDLGQWWEDQSGMPIPLGAIVARRSLGRDKVLQIERTIGASVEFAFKKPEACLDYIRQYSQEMDEKVVQSHIGLYVNDYSRDLGAEGFAAIELFLARGREAGALPPSNSGLRI
ncbi:1,4-dihydroxy-6-naphthoate synthase [Desulfosediminicola ganghwensis]|uniref:1,4-dihydroxy-6-naphthoate synthase n=1 Tax=Desulfosediminicola ganghwensis TaxID=2569540 RepID=UPI0010AD0387|nr:1,4-dihydroxy-6-naphthoate synthase [Desulfosediminicola ganghwensis]